MQKASQLIHNFVLLSLLVGIVATATITTLSLSPVAVGTQAQAAGVSVADNPNLLSHPLPLVAKDLADVQSGYVSQLSAWGDNRFQYNIQLGPQRAETFSKQSLEFSNPNSVPVTINIDVNVPKETANSFSVNVFNSDRSWRLHTARSNDDRSAAIEIPAQSKLQLGLKYEYEQGVNFPSEITLTVRY